jgi:DNA-binding SARP family transcriptional activator
LVTLSIRLLGRFEVLRGGQSLSGSEWRSRQTRAILKLLVIRCGHVVTTDQLLDLLWPDEEPEAARRRLHVRVSQLRRALAPDDPAAYVLTMEGGYSFDPEVGCWVDTWEFESQTGRARRCQEAGDLDQAIAAYETARSLYRGDLLEEDLYADWTFAERERLRERFLTMLTELAECYAQQGRYRRAVARCHDVLAADLRREAVYVRLMLYHYYAGEQVRALRAFERCRQVLADELEVEPLPGTFTLAEQIRAGILRTAGDAPRYPPPAYEGRLFEVPYSLGRTPFVGRQAEYDQLVQLVQKTTTGGLGLVVVSGEAGLGKTRLVQEALAYARQRDIAVLEGRCFEMEGGLPYEPFTQALRGYLPMVEARHLHRFPNVWLAEVARLLPELTEVCPDLPPNAPLPPAYQHGRLFEGIARFVAHASLRQPLILFLDDLHWADRPTLELLHYVARKVVGERVLLAGAFRGEELSEGSLLLRFLRAMGREGTLHRIDLQPLPGEAVAELIDQMSGSASGMEVLCQRIYDETKGNPLFCVATLQNLFEAGVLSVADSGAWILHQGLEALDDAGRLLPPTVRDVIEARLARLGADSRRLLSLAAVVGQVFDPAVLRQAGGWDEATSLEMLGDLSRRRLLEETNSGQRCRFAHPKMREVIYAGLGASQRAVLHRKVGQAMEALYGDRLGPVAGQLAHHFQLAGEAPQGVHYAILASQEALRVCAHQEAIEHLRQGLETAEAADLTLTPAQRLTLWRSEGAAHEMAGRYDQARDCYEEAIAQAGTALDCDGLVFKIAYLDVLCGTPIPALLQRAKPVDQALAETQAPLVKAHHSLTKGYAFLYQGDAEQAKQSYHLGWQIIAGLAATDRAGRYTFDLAKAHLALGQAYLWWGEHARSARELQVAEALCHQIGDVERTMRCRLLLGELRARTGAWEHALADLDEVVTMAARVEHPSLRAEALFRRGYVYCDQGDWQAAEADAHLSQSIAGAIGDAHNQGGAQFLMNRILIKRGQAAAALASCQAMQGMLRALDSGLYLCLALRYLAEVCVAMGDAEQAMSHCREGLEVARRAGFQREVGVLQRVWGEGLALQGRYSEAGVRLRASLAVLRGMDSPYEEAESQRALGRLYEACGQGEMAKGHLEAALASFQELGARHDASVTRALLSALAGAGGGVSDPL